MSAVGRPAESSSPKFLLIKLNHLGDTLLMTASTRFLRQQYPGARIDVVVRKGCEAVLIGNPDIDNIHTVAAPKHERGNVRHEPFIGTLWSIFRAGYDYAFDLSNSDRAKLLILASRARVRGINDAYGQVSGWRRRIFNAFSSFAWAREHQVLRDFRLITDVLGVEAPAPALYINTDISLAQLRARCPELPESSYVVIHPVSRWPFKHWLPGHWAQLADRLSRERGLHIVFSCGPGADERAYVQAIVRQCTESHACTDGRFNLRELAALIARSTLFIGVDTVAMHIAAAAGAPCVALFGPSSEWSWHPWHCRYELVLGDCNCKLTRKFICDKSQPFPCMAGISVDAVMAAVERIHA